MPALRRCGAAIGRRVNTLCQGETGLRDPWAFFQVYHNFVLPHASLRQPLGSVAKLLFQEFGSLEVIEFLTPDFWILPQKSNFATEPAGATQPSWCSPLGRAFLWHKSCVNT
jgi:hypothetical protein